MEYRKRYSNAEQEMVIGLYQESGRTLSEFCEGEGLEVGRVERWLKQRGVRKANEVKFVEVEQEAAVATSMLATEFLGKYRLGFANGSWLEIEGGFKPAAVRELIEILREGKC